MRERARTRPWPSWNDRLSKRAAASGLSVGILLLLAERFLFGSPRSEICAGGVGVGRPSRAQRMRGEAPGRQDERQGGVEWNSVERSACGFAEPIGRDASFSAPKAPGQDSNLCHQPAFAQDLYLGPMRDFAELKRSACVLILPVGRRIHLRTYQVIDPPFRISLPRLDHLSAILKGRGRLPSHCAWLARAVPVLAGIHEPKHRRDGSFSTSGCDHAFDQPAYGKPCHCAEQEHRSEDQDVLRLHELRFETQRLKGEHRDGSSWAIGAPNSSKIKDPVCGPPTDLPIFGVFIAKVVCETPKP
jgi:hypothetical protein